MYEHREGVCECVGVGGSCGGGGSSRYFNDLKRVIPEGVYSLRRHETQKGIISIYSVKREESNSSWLCELSTGFKAKQVWAGLPALDSLAGEHGAS